MPNSTAISYALPLPTVVFDPSAVGSQLTLQAFCLNPPKNSCDFGPCPNPDVTGVGQQVSTYIASVAFVITLLYCSKLIRPMLYAHLGLVYSLLIASSASIGRGELTQNDGVFVLVTVASPASFSLWFLTLWSLWRPGRFPVQNSNSTEEFFLKVLSIGSLAFEVIMICLVFAPSSHLNFSQPACNRLFGDKLWVDLLWELPYIVQAAWLIIVLGIFGHAFKKRTFSATCPKYTTYDWCQWEARTQDTVQSDIVTWTERSLAKHEVTGLPATSYTLTAIITVLQFVAFPNIGFFVNQNFLVCLLLFRAYIMDQLLGTEIHFNFPMSRLSPILLAGCALVLSTILGSNFPTSSDAVLAFASLVVIFRWSRSLASSEIQVWRVRLLFISGLVLALVGSSFAWTIARLETSLEGRNSFLVSKIQPSFLNTYTLPFWILAWLATSVWPACKGQSYTEIWDSAMGRAHILKAGLLVVTPNVAWIQSSITSNPTKPTDMTFGQIFALIVSVVSVVSLLDAARNTDIEVWKAFFLSKPFTISQKANVSHMSRHVPATVALKLHSSSRFELFPPQPAHFG